MALTPKKSVIRQVSAVSESPPVSQTIENSHLEAGGPTAIEPALAQGLRPLQTPPKDKPPGNGKPLDFSKRLEIPRELPGADAPPIVLPPVDLDVPGLRDEAIDALFPLLPTMRPNLEVKHPPEQKRMSLDELQEMALSNNPLVVQAAADVDSAVGVAVDVGAYPNPTVGYEADTVGSAGTRNYQGIFFTQTIKTAGKLELAQASANVDLMDAQLALRRARIDLITRIRSQYFAVLVAKQAVVASSALVRFTNEVYRVQVDQVKGSQAAAYEPMQLRVLAVQARAALVQAQNRYASAWKQLAAAIGIPDLPLAELEGKPDVLVPAIDYDAAVSYLLGSHTAILTARNAEHRARIDLRREEVAPIPDVLVYSAIQRDFTTPGAARTTYNVQLGLPLPIFDRNKGGILNAKGKLLRAVEETGRVRNDLAGQVADAFERYETNRVLADYYKNQILPDQSRVYRGTYERHQQEPDAVGFFDVVLAQQNLLNSIASYISALNAQWQAVTDLAALVQVENLYEVERLGAAPAEPVQLPPPPAEPPAKIPAEEPAK